MGEAAKQNCAFQSKNTASLPDWIATRFLVGSAIQRWLWLHFEKNAFPD
jgi:hypothetical protein